MRRFDAMRAGLLAVTMTLVLAAAPARADVPPVFEHVPGDAPVVVAVPSLSHLAERLALLNQRMGLDQPMLADPIGMSQMMLGVQEGVDLDRSAALVMLSLPDPDDFASEPAMAMLVPVTDYDAFLANFDPQGDGDVRGIVLMGEPSFVRQVDNYALIGDAEQPVADFQAAGDTAPFGQRAGTVGVDAMTGADLMVLLDLEQLGPTALETVMAGMMMAQQFGDPDMQGAFDLNMMLMEAVFTQGAGAVFGLRVSEDGIALDSSVQFQDGSNLADAFAEGPAERPRLDRLPSQRYVLAGSMDLRNLPLEDWMEQLRIALAGDDQFSVMMRQMISDDVFYNANSQALFDPSFGFGASLFNGVTVSITDDPAGALQAFRDEVEAMDGLPLGGDMHYQTSYQEQVQQIGGHDVHRYSVQMDIPAEAMAELGPAAMFVTQDMGGFVVTTDDALIVAQGTATELLEATLALAATDETLDDDGGISRVREQLAAQPMAEGFVNVGALLEMANEFLMMFNPEAALDVPEDLPPLGLSLAVADGGMGSRLYVPMPVIDTVREIVTRFAGDVPLELGEAPGGEFEADAFDFDAEGFDSTPPPAPPEAGDQAAAPAADPPAAPAEPAPAPTPEPAAEPAEPREAEVLAVAPGDFRDQVLDADQVVLVVFTADWDDNSQRQQPITRGVAGTFDAFIRVAEVDVDEDGVDPLLDQYEIEYVPTLIIFKDGEEVERKVGVTTRGELGEALARHIRDRD